MRDSLTTVIDAGARYGMHPSWKNFGGDLLYLAFEPDAKEARRLRKKNGHPGFKVIPQALAAARGRRILHIIKHRGYCSFLKPDLNSEWFRHYRPGEGSTQGTVPVWASTIDDFAQSRGIRIDFLKVDTEGTELEVLQGGQRQLGSHIIGVRINVNFQPAYQGHAMFPEIHNHLTQRGFFLLNLDYFGKGLPRNSLFRKPDPLSEDDQRYGILFATDAVWLKYDRLIFENRSASPESLAFAALKYAYFCMLNHAPDVAIDTLLAFVRKYPHWDKPKVRGVQALPGPATDLRRIPGTLAHVSRPAVERSPIHVSSHFPDEAGSSFRACNHLEKSP